MHVEYVKENYYANFHYPTYHRYREMNGLTDLEGRTDGLTDGKLDSYIAPCYEQVP